MVVDSDHVAEIRGVFSLEITNRSRCELRTNIIYHLDIVTRFELRCRDKSLDINLIQTELEFVPLVGWIDIDQNKVRHGGGELSDDPLVVIHGVNSDSVVFLEAETS